MKTVLITAAELAEELIGDRPPVVLDIRWSLSGSDRNGYQAGHIPGALFVDLDTELAAPVGDGSAGRHPLPDPKDLQRAWRRVGINFGDRVVVYDAKDSSAAARAWWLLRWSGIADVRVLDGGMAEWQDAGLWVKAGSGTPLVPGGVVVRPGQMMVVDADRVAAMAGSAATAVLDARAAPRFRGEVEPIDPVAGHIPGAVSLPFTSLVTADGHFKPPTELRTILAAAGVEDGSTAVAYCGSGVTACHLVLGAAVVGIELALYPGSWSQWCALGLPVAVGA